MTTDAWHLISAEREREEGVAERSVDSTRSRSLAMGRGGSKRWWADSPDLPGGRGVDRRGSAHGQVQTTNSSSVTRCPRSAKSAIAPSSHASEIPAERGTWHFS